MPSSFTNTPENPYHLSVGVILQKDDGTILTHRFAPALHGLGEFELYTLMRETLEDNESLEAAAHRGLKEEFGATAKLERFLGSIVCTFYQPRISTDVEKTTCYFLARPLSFTETAREDDVEGKSILEWHPVEFLIEQHRKQGKQSGRADVDESAILSKLLR